MKNDKLKKFFEDNNFNVHTSDDSNDVEVETWTDGGVNMIICLYSFTKEDFNSYVDDFDVDEQIELHRQAEDYKRAFTIRESLNDFTDFHNRLKEVEKKLNQL